MVMDRYSNAGEILTHSGADQGVVLKETIIAGRPEPSSIDTDLLNEKIKCPHKQFICGCRADKKSVQS